MIDSVFNYFALVGILRREIQTIAEVKLAWPSVRTEKTRIIALIVCTIFTVRKEFFHHLQYQKNFVR